MNWLEVENYTVGTATVSICHDEEPDNPRNWSCVGTMLGYDGYDLGDSDSELYGQWRAAVERHCAYWSGWSLGAALVGERYDGDSGFIYFAESSDEVVWSEVPDYRVIIPMEASAGTYARAYATDQIIGKKACREYIAAVLDGDTVPNGLYVITADDVRRELGVINRHTLKEMTGYALNEIEVYEQYLQGDVYNYYIETPDGETDSCCGFYGYEYCKDEADGIAAGMHSAYIESVKQEAVEAANWQYRGVVTVG